MLPRITQQSHSAAPRRESQIEPWLANSPPPGLCSFSTEKRRSADVKTTRELRISAPQACPQGLDVRELFPFQRREKCFLLTSPFIELAVQIYCTATITTWRRWFDVLLLAGDKRLQARQALLKFPILLLQQLDLLLLGCDYVLLRRDHRVLLL